MPKGNHLLLSDEMRNWVRDQRHSPARVGMMIVAATLYWDGEEDLSAAENSLPEDLRELGRVLLGQVANFRASRLGGIDSDEKRETERRRKANYRARKAGLPEPYPELSRVPNVPDGTNGTERDTRDKMGQTGQMGQSGTDFINCPKPNQTNPNQTSAGAQARVCACEEDRPFPPDAMPSKDPSNAEVVFRFNTIWEAYPERRRASRPKAMEAFREKMAQGLVPSEKELLDSLLRWKASFDWRKSGGMYIPSIANWIEQERWNDTPAGEYTADTIPLSEAAPSAVPPMDEETRRLFATA